jgi:DNA topoisomerase IB
LRVAPALHGRRFSHSPPAPRRLHLPGHPPRAPRPRVSLSGLRRGGRDRWRGSRARAQLKRRHGGGDDLLAYKRGRRWVDVRSADINEFLKEATDLEISAKDFRTWGATVLGAVALAVSGQASATKTGRKRAVTRAVKEVAHYLGNTPAVARASYIDPRVFDRFREGRAIDSALVATAGGAAEATAIQGPVEEAVLDLLE